MFVRIIFWSFWQLLLPFLMFTKEKQKKLKNVTYIVHTKKKIK